MNKSIYYFLLLIFLTVSCVQEDLDSPKLGKVTISKIIFDDLEVYAPNSRTSSLSGWQHLLPKEAELFFTNKATGEVFKLTYDPYALLSGEEILLPFGAYTYHTKVWAPQEASFLPYSISGEFELSSTDLDLTIKATTLFGLITVDATHVKEAYLDGGKPLQLTEDGKYHYLYVRKGTKRTVSVVENFSRQILQQEVTLSGFRHYHFLLELDESEYGATLVTLNLGAFHFDYSGIAIEGEEQTVTDAEGNIYQIEKIGDQYWMAENLASRTYCNGETIPELKLPMKWEDNTFNEYVLTNVDASRGLTNFYYPSSVATSEENICPCNWHVSTDEDWKTLERYLGIAESELESTSHLRGIGAELADKIMANDWLDHYPEAITGVTITNTSRFSAYPTGGVDWDYESDYYFGINTTSASVWYSNTAIGAIMSRAIFPNGNGVYDGSGIMRGRSPYGRHLPIRCVKD